MPVSLSFLNTGNTTWTPGAGYALAVITDGCSLAPSNRVPITSPASVQPGEIGTFNVVFNSIPAPNACDIEFRMVEEFVEFFGATHTLNIPIVAGTNDAQFVSHTLPTSFPPSSGYYISFTFRNLGTKGWFAGSNHALKVSSDVCSLFAASTYPVDGNNVTLTNQNYGFTVFVSTPPTDGSCSFDLQMTEIGDGDFGAIFNGVLNVESPPNAVRDWTRYE